MAWAYVLNSVFINFCYPTCFIPGRLFAQDIAAFARQSIDSRLHMLGPDSFPNPVINSGKLWFVDFFSPVSLLLRLIWNDQLIHDEEC